MLKFTMLSGIPASGKSSYARELEIEGTKIHSSDTLRKEIYGCESIQVNNNDIFEELNRRVVEDLNKGISVIYDATNLSRRKRVHMISNILGKIDCEKEIIHINIPIEEALKRNRERNRKVPDEVIERMYKNVHIPQYKEGWDKIYIKQIENSDKELNIPDICDIRKLEFKGTYKCMMGSLELLELVYNKPQNNKHHTLSIDRHTYKVYDYLRNSGVDDIMLWAALLHDVGKDYCRETDYCTMYDKFIGHENVSAQIALDRLSRVRYKGNRFEIEEVLGVVDIVQNHMLYLNENKLEKDKKNSKIDQEYVQKLEYFREADMSGK